MYETTPPPLLSSRARSRRPLPPDGYEELREATLAERRGRRLAALDRHTGRIDLTVPLTPTGAAPLRSASKLPPTADATGGRVPVVRNTWLAKYDPRRAERERQKPARDRQVNRSDVWQDFAWGDPGRALGEPWVCSWLMRGAGNAIGHMSPGDLVFVTRTGWRGADVAWLHRRTIVGLWWVESTSTWPETDAAGRLRWFSEAACFPIRRFDFPVPVNATRDIDRAFAGVATFSDMSRQALAPLAPPEALAVARACGLPAMVLSEPDPDRLAPMCAGLDLGPPTAVRQRILDGARAVAHRSAVEGAARDVAVAALRRHRLAVVSTERERGIGSDLWLAPSNATDP